MGSWSVLDSNLFLHLLVSSPSGHLCVGFALCPGPVRLRGACSAGCVGLGLQPHREDPGGLSIWRGAKVGFPLYSSLFMSISQLQYHFIIRLQHFLLHKRTWCLQLAFDFTDSKNALSSLFKFVCHCCCTCQHAHLKHSKISFNAANEQPTQHAFSLFVFNISLRVQKQHAVALKVVAMVRNVSLYQTQMTTVWRGLYLSVEGLGRRQRSESDTATRT